MNIGLGIEVDSELERLADGLSRIDQKLKLFFSSRDYGEDVSNIFIGLILTGPGSERLHPMRPVKYKKNASYWSRLTGQRIEQRNVVQFDVKPDYASLRRMNAEAAVESIAETIVGGSDQLLRAQQRFPNFDAVQFQRDLKACLAGSHASE